MNRERTWLLHSEIDSGLTVFFATLCIVDIFGVFPIIALPSAIVQCGLLGIPLVIVVILLQIYTAVLLGKSWIIASTLDPHIATKNRYPLAAVTELTLGPKIRTLVTIFLDLTVFGCGIPNLLVASQNLQLFGLKVSDNQFDLSFCYWLLVVGLVLCPLMWLGSPRDMKSLAIFSTMIVVITAISVWWCIIADNRVLTTQPVPTAPRWDKFISGYSMLAFQFDLHPTVMTVQVDMRNPRDINKAIISSFFISSFLFGITTGLSCWKYGGSTKANILQLAPASNASRVAILLSALQLIFSSVIGHTALFLHLEDELHVQRRFGWKRCAMRSAVLLLGVAVGESVPRFDIVMSLIGGTLTGPLVFILPPIMYARCRALKAQAESQSSRPEVLSTAHRRSAEDATFDRKAHSQSTYYGMTSGDDRRKHYSYIYYDEDDDSSELLSDVDSYSASSSKKRSNVIPLVEKNTPDTLVLVDATKPERIRERKINEPVESRETSKLNRWLMEISDYFGYLIVALGIIITVSSTYINVKNTVRFVKFTPPCIINASYIG